MPRPKKDPALLREEMLRIPVTESEKGRILAAAVATDGEFARWARAILLKAADDYSASKEIREKRTKHKGGALKESA